MRSEYGKRFLAEREKAEAANDNSQPDLLAAELLELRRVNGGLY
jgi:hypothetical protein